VPPLPQLPVRKVAGIKMQRSGCSGGFEALGL